MTAWDILTANSTAPAGSTAWVHLNNQAGGGLGDGVIIVDNYEVGLEMLVAVQIEETSYSAEVVETVAVALESNEITVEVAE